jgi:hypothetical protein
MRGDPPVDVMTRRLGTWLIAFAFGAVAACAVSAESPAPQRLDRLKAGYLVNFVKFIEWPASAPANELTLCFIGAEGVLNALPADLSDRLVAGRRLIVRELKPDELSTGCGVLYVDRTAATPHASVMQTPTLPGAGVLTVSDDANFIRQGGVIELFTEDNRLRFNINVQNAQRAGLKISSALLQLASSVDREAS